MRLDRLDPVPSAAHDRPAEGVHPGEAPPLSTYVFPGYPPYLETAAAELGHPESADPARRVAALTSLANLCAQATHGNPAHVPEILAKAAEFRDQLATALRAAELMLADVEAAWFVENSPVESESLSGSNDGEPS